MLVRQCGVALFSRKVLIIGVSVVRDWRRVCMGSNCSEYQALCDEGGGKTC